MVDKPLDSLSTKLVNTFSEIFELVFCWFAETISSTIFSNIPISDCIIKFDTRFKDSLSSPMLDVSVSFESAIS